MNPIAQCKKWNEDILITFSYPIALLKFTCFIFLLLFFIGYQEVLQILLKDNEKRLRHTMFLVKNLSRLGLFILNIDVDKKLKAEVSPTGSLLIANHLSYVDVLILFASYPSLFITSQEIRETFLLGRITKLAGCFFVERRKERRTNETLKTEISDIKSKLMAGYNIFLFPEGTSSNGKQVLPFKATFFQTAIDCALPIKPLCLKYTSSNRDDICWYGKMTFPDHLFRLCLQTKISARLEQLAEIPVSASDHRFTVRDRAFNSISEAYEKN